MFAVTSLVAFIIAIAVGTHSLNEPTFWFLLGLALLALHEVCVHFIPSYNRTRPQR